jgi:hypothetical protein
MLQTKKKKKKKFMATLLLLFEKQNYVTQENSVHQTKLIVCNRDVDKHRITAFRALLLLIQMHKNEHWNLRTAAP